jgi:RNA ligase (TIGR02306 family)
MSDKNLATIQTITDIQPIPNADAVEVASVMGWKCVVKRNEFKIGDKCIYVAIDTLVPETPQFEFLRKTHFRIKTCRIRKQLSQGIVFPLTIIQDQQEWVDGQDVTEVVGIRKYEKPIPANMAGIIKGSFPSYISKTDEINVKSIPAIIDEIKGKEVYISVKCDGTSGTFGCFNGEIDVCSRNLSLKETEGNVYWEMFHKYNMKKMFDTVGNFVIQGECVGEGIQKNPMKLKGHELFVFQVYDIFNAKYLDYADFLNFCKAWNLQTVPIEKVCIFDFTLEQLAVMAQGNYSSGSRREGIVIRPVIECYSNVVDKHDPSLRGRMSLKSMNDSYLEKDEE